MKFIINQRNLIYLKTQNTHSMDHKTFYLDQPNFPTIQSIEAQSEYSVDLRPHENDSLLMQILLLSIELDRKDFVIQNLQNNTNRSQQMRQSQVMMTQNKDLEIRLEKLQIENRSLIQANAVLRSKLTLFERKASQVQLYKTNAKYNQQLEDRMYSLEAKLKKAEQLIIEKQEHQKKLKTQLSMLSYENVVKASQKNKIKQLELQVNTLKKKLQKQVAQSIEQKHLIQRYNQDIHHLKQKQQKTHITYEEKIQLMRVNEDLRQSQCYAANDDKIVLLTQQLNRLKQELQFCRNQNGSLSTQVNQCNEEINKLHSDLNCYESELQTFQRNYGELQEELTKAREISEKYKSVIKKNESKEESLKKQIQEREKNTQILQNTINRYSSEETKKTKTIENLKLQLIKSEDEITQVKTELRKAKRSSNVSNIKQCQICKLKLQQNTSPKNNSSIQSIDLEEIIRQTQKLKLSDNKIESLISYHEFASQNSIELKSHSRITKENIHQ